jgi:Recombination endonuclease VII
MMTTNNGYYKGRRLLFQEYDALLKSQNGVCAACGKPEQSTYKGKPRMLAVDHCHVTGRVRGLLCGHCNRALGLLRENPEHIKALLLYVETRCVAEYDIQGEIRQHYIPEDSAENKHIKKLESLYGL